MKVIICKIVLPIPCWWNPVSLLLPRRQRRPRQPTYFRFRRHYCCDWLQIQPQSGVDGGAGSYCGIMVTWVVKFPGEGYKIRQILVIFCCWQLLTIFDSFFLQFYHLTIFETHDLTNKRQQQQKDNDKDNPMTRDIWDTDYNSDNCEPEFMTIFVSSEGALYVILPYDYPAAPTFWPHTGP